MMAQHNHLTSYYTSGEERPLQAGPNHGHRPTDSPAYIRRPVSITCGRARQPHACNCNSSPLPFPLPSVLTCSRASASHRWPPRQWRGMSSSSRCCCASRPARWPPAPLTRRGRWSGCTSSGRGISPSGSPTGAPESCPSSSQTAKVPYLQCSCLASCLHLLSLLWYQA